MRNVALGTMDFSRGARFVMSRPRLYPYLAAPFVVSLVLLAVVGWGVWTLATPGADWVAAAVPSWLSSIVGDALRVVLLAVLALGGVVVFVGVASLVTAPFCEMLSEAVECEVLGKEGESFAVRDVTVELLRGIGHALRRVVLYLVMMGVVLLIGLAVPVLGPAVAAVLGALATIRFAAFDAADAIMARRRWSYAAKKQFLKAHSGRSFGLGAVIAGCLLVPGLNLIALPLGAAGATLLFIDVEKRTAP